MDDLDVRVAVLVRELRGVGRSSRLLVANRIGELVVKHLFGGERSQLWERASRDEAYSHLQRHADLPIAASELNRAVQVFELCHRMPWVSTSKGITLSHVAEVLALSHEAQRELLERASEERWTVRRLRQAVQASAPVGPPTGRPRMPATLKLLASLLHDDHRHGAFRDIDCLLAVEPACARRWLDACPGLRKDLDRVEALLRVAAAQLGRPRSSVLVVDSDPAFAARVRSYLQRQRCTVRLARCSRDALALAAVPLRCAVIDLHLPRTCVEELAGELQRQHPGLACVWTASVDEVSRGSCGASMTPIVPKSAGLLELRVAVGRAILDAT